MPCGGGIYGGQTHSQSPEALFTHVCGLKTVMPSQPVRRQGPADRRDRGRRPGDLPRAEAALQRPVRRPSRPAGRAVVAASAGRGARRPLHRAARHGRDAPRRAATSRCSPTAPWCYVAEAAAARDRHRRRDHRPAHAPAARPRHDRRVGREDRPLRRSCTRRRAPRGFGAELSALVQEHCFYHLEAPIERVTGWDTPYPHAQEWDYFPGPDARRPRRSRAVMEA